MACSSLPGQAHSEMLSGLLARISAGETHAFAELHTITRGKLRRIALAVGAAPHDVDDILQEGFLKIWRNAARFDSERASAMTWMSAIVRHTAIDHLRTRRQPSVELDEALTVPSSAGPSPTEDFDYVSAEPIALGALARLPEDRRRRERNDGSRLRRPVRVGLRRPAPLRARLRPASFRGAAGGVPPGPIAEFGGFSRPRARLIARSA